MGSMTPCGNDGADPTRAIVCFVMAPIVAVTSARWSSATGTLTSLMPKYLAALSKATCADVGTTSSGRVIRFVWRAQSR